MLLLTASDLSISFGTDAVLEKVSFSVSENDRLGVIGVNGCGKSTLLKLLCGELEPTFGAVHLARGKTVGILRQDDAFLAADRDMTLSERMLAAFPDLLDAERPLLLISFARSGNSPESVGAVNIANKLCKNVAHIYITCNKNGKLALQAQDKENILLLLLPEETDDKSLAMTSSFSTMLLTCLMLGHIDTLEKDVEKIEKAVKNAEVVIERYEPELKAIGERPFERGVFLGSGALKGIAEECHLKLQELTDGAVVCKFDSFLGFRHGPKAVVNDKSIVVYLMTDEEKIMRYERDLVRQVDSNNKPVAQVIVISGRDPEMEEVHADLVVKMPYCKAETDFYGIIPYVLVGQLLGFYASKAHGLNPDAPSVSGNIHRVVEGVTIYE